MAVPEEWLPTTEPGLSADFHNFRTTPPDLAGRRLFFCLRPPLHGLKPAMPALAFAATARLRRLLSLGSFVTGRHTQAWVRIAAVAACRLALGRPGGETTEGVVFSSVPKRERGAGKQEDVRDTRPVKSMRVVIAPLLFRSTTNLTHHIRSHLPLIDF